MALVSSSLHVLSFMNVIFWISCYEQVPPTRKNWALSAVAIATIAKEAVYFRNKADVRVRFPVIREGKSWNDQATVSHQCD